VGFQSTAHRRGFWLLIRLAAQNVGRRRARALFLGAAVMLGIVARIPGVALVAPQRIVPALVEDQAVNLIAFDPVHDFSVLPWLEEHKSGPIEGLIAGFRATAPLSAAPSVCGMPLPVYGRLARTGVGPFDDSYFIRFETLADIVAFCRASGGDRRPSVRSERPTPAAPGMSHADVCSPDLPLERVSTFLLQLSAGAKPEQVKFSLAQLADIKVVEGNSVLTSSRQALSTLIVGIAVFACVQLIALLIVISLLFSAIVRERHREIGLLRALGANANQVMTVILAEAAIITGLGGLAGLAFGAAVLLAFARSLGFYFGLLGVPFSWPAVSVLQAGALCAVALALVLGIFGACLPAWRVRRMAPYALIHASGS
jgi:putative ABC transport system permease protein